MDHAVTVLPG